MSVAPNSEIHRSIALVKRVAGRRDLVGERGECDLDTPLGIVVKHQVRKIDQSITAGPGLRWPVHGPCLTFHLAGGQGGIGHMLDQFGPSLQSPWTRLVSTELTPSLRAAIVEGCEREADGRTIDELVAERDRGVIAVMRALGRV